MTIVTISGALAAQVAQGGTFDVSYPEGKDRGSFAGGTDVALSLDSNTLLTAPEDFTVSYGASAVTVTYNGATTLAAATAYILQLDEAGADPVRHNGVAAHTPVDVSLLNLGSPGAADADGIFASASLTLAEGTTAALTGALVDDGVAILDARTGRNVVAAWTGAAVLTVTGTDMYGNAMTESSASGTSFTGKKAFKTVTEISVSANVTLLTVGTGDVLGLPAYTPNAALVLKESVDGAAATAGTIVAGLAIATKPTATNADVRGTYDPNAACDGSKNFQLLAAVTDPTFLGAEQYAA